MLTSVLRACGLILLLWSGAAVAATNSNNSVRITLLTGPATLTVHDDVRAATVGDGLSQGDSIQTGSARAELALPDGSTLRLAEQTVLRILRVENASPEARKLQFLLKSGRVWAHVVGVIGVEARFEIETPRLVTGVRGTTFRVDAAPSGDVVRTYAGGVAVAAADELPKKRGPKGLIQCGWEKLISAGMRFSISAAGEPGEVTPFSAVEDAKDEWVQWNMARDASSR